MVTEYKVSCLPADDVNARWYTLKVVRQRDGRWSIKDGPFIYDVNGDTEFESASALYDEKWKSTRLFDETTALELAKRFAPLMELNGVTVTGERVTREEE